MLHSLAADGWAPVDIPLMKFSICGPVWHLPPAPPAIRELSHGIAGHLSSSTRVFPDIDEKRGGGGNGAVTVTSGSEVRASCVQPTSAHRRIAPAAATATAAITRIVLSRCPDRSPLLPPPSAKDRTTKGRGAEAKIAAAEQSGRVADRSSGPGERREMPVIASIREVQVETEGVDMG